MRASWAGSTGTPGRRCATASTAGATPGPCAPASAVTRTPIWPHWSSGHASQFCRRSFFGQSIGIADAHHAVLALAHRDAGFAPGAALLPAQPSRVQGAPDRERADPGQPIRSVAQGSLQQAQRPRRRAVLLALWGSRPFGQDALLRVSPIAGPWSAPMPRPHSGEPLAVEAADPGGDGLIVPSSDLVGRCRVAGPLSNGQERSGALHLRGGSAERAAQAGQLLAFIRRERAKGICPVA